VEPKDWIGVVVAIIAVISAWVAARSARESRASAARAEAAVASRAAGRTALREAMDIGNALAEDFRKTTLDNHDALRINERYQTFEAIADAAVTLADSAQLPRYHAPLTPGKRSAHLAERLRRLQDIQDRL
jgi:type II secretory pathway pseudopilin PulG